MGADRFIRKITAIMSADFLGYSSHKKYNLIHAASNCL